MRALTRSLTLSFALGMSVLGSAASCASGDAAGDPQNGNADTGTDGADRDGKAGSDASPLTACAPGDTSSEACGKCGAKTRGCTTGGSWEPYGACAGELAEAECAIGETRDKVCGNCGLRKDTCDESACLWINGACGGEKECAAGTSEAKACASATETQSRTCSDVCTWGAFSPCAATGGWKTIAASPLSGRTHATAIWTGSAMIVFGGTDASERKADGASYTPTTDAWKTIAAAPSTFSKGRTDATAVWTGSSMLVWGGFTGDGFFSADGASYDPTTDTWKTIAASPLSARASMRAVWSTTTHEMIVWGGDTGSPSAEGAAYDPTSDTWTMLPAAPIGARTLHSMVFTGDVDHGVLVWGGGNGGIAGLKDGARFDVMTRSWTKLPDPPAGFDPRYNFGYAYSGTELLLFGGYGGTDFPTLAKSTGARVTPGGVWTAWKIPDDAVLTPTAKRYSLQAWADSGKLFVWSGLSVSAPTAVTGGAVYDVASDAWTKMDTTGAPTARKDAQVVWTGSTTQQAIVWGGTDGLSTYFADGGTFHP